MLTPSSLFSDTDYETEKDEIAAETLVTGHAIFAEKEAAGAGARRVRVNV